MTNFTADQTAAFDAAFAAYDTERRGSDDQLAADNARIDAMPVNGFSEMLNLRGGARAGAAIQHGLRNSGLALDLLFALQSDGLITIHFEQED